MLDFLFAIIEFVCYLLRLKGYKRQPVEVGTFSKGVGYFEAKF